MKSDSAPVTVAARWQVFPDRAALAAHAAELPLGRADHLLAFGQDAAAGV